MAVASGWTIDISYTMVGLVEFWPDHFSRTQLAHAHFELATRGLSYKPCHVHQGNTLYLDLAFYSNFGSLSGRSITSCHEAKDWRTVHVHGHVKNYNSSAKNFTGIWG